jgi:hypothetical protein
MKKLLLALLACAGIVPMVQGQTGRIAHFSHGGGSKALATSGVADNFGISYVEQEWKNDSIVTVSSTTVEHRGQRRMRYADTKQGASPWKRDVASYPIADKQMLQAIFPKAVVDGAPKKKKHTKRTSGHMHAFLKRPFQYSNWRGLTAVVALGTVGWLLGKKRSA